MNYLVIAVVLIAAALWLLGIILGAIAKAAGEGIAAAHKLGTATASGFRRGVRYVSRGWVLIEIPTKLTDCEKLIIEGRSQAQTLRSWKPARIVSAQQIYPEFQQLSDPGVRGAGFSIQLDDLGSLRQMTDPQPSAVLHEIVSRDCSFPRTKPGIPAHETNWPNPLAAVASNLPRARFEFLKPGSMRHLIVRWAYSTEKEVVAKTAAHLASLSKELEEANASIEAANARLAKRRADYREELEAQVSSEFAAYKTAKDAYIKACAEEKARFLADLDAYTQGNAEALSRHFRQGLWLLSLPQWFSTDFNVGLDETGRALIVDVELPNLPDVELHKTVITPTGKASSRPPNKKESTQALGTLHPLALLRIACEAAQLDTGDKLDLIAVNGWVAYRSRTTGQPQTAYVASLIGDPKELRGVSLPDVDPIAAFKHFRGQSAFVVDDVVPLKPQLVLNRNDPRFVEAKDVMGGLQTNTNLATMDWQDFEHLIRDLFERLYQGIGVEVKVTQASRDRGVDAVVLDPDPIRGGKTVIQAKRYMNTVDVSAVRDLYGTVHNEGASRGILVTTSSFGPDSYQFAEGKPLTLINGSQLLAYLKEAGKDVRIDLEEARRLANL